MQTKDVSLVSLETELDPHLIPELNNLVTSYICPYLDGKTLVQKARDKKADFVKEHKRILRQNIQKRVEFSPEIFKMFKKQVEDGFKNREKFDKDEPCFIFSLSLDPNYLFEKYLYMCGLSCYTGVENCKGDSYRAFFNLKRVNPKNQEQLDLELFPDINVENEAKVEYEKDFLIFDKKIREYVEKYSHILKKYVIQGFNEYLEGKVDVYTIKIKIPMIELDYSKMAFSILKKYIELSEIEPVTIHSIELWNKDLIPEKTGILEAHITIFSESK